MSDESAQKRREPTEAMRSLVDHEIQRLIASPPEQRRTDPSKRWPETERANAIGAKAVQQFRELACKRTGMTMEQLLEAEANVNHPRAIVPVEVTPSMLARRRMTAAGVPELYIKCVADKQPIDCKPLVRVRDFLQSSQGFLMLSGGKGARKSGSASWSLGQLDGGAFVNVYDIIRLRIEDRPAWDRVLAAPLVVLDDLGTETVDQKGAFVAAFHELFNTAYSQCRRLIMTGNITPAQFKAEPDKFGYGSRVADRFREAGAWFNVTGESVRSAMGAQRHWSDEREPGEDD